MTGILITKGFIFETSFHYVSQVGHKILGLSNPPALDSQVLGLQVHTTVPDFRKGKFEGGMDTPTGR